jgi:hypothetical protein
VKKLYRELERLGMELPLGEVEGPTPWEGVVV